MSEEGRSVITAEWSRKIYERLQSVLPRVSSEADFRREMDKLLDEFCVEIGLTPQSRAEYTLATGRADTVFNRLVIEYKRPGVLKKTPDAATQHAIEQVKGYMIGLAKKERHKVERLAGVVFDGCFLIFVRYINGRWTEEGPFEVNTHSLERFLTWLASLSSGIALTSENLNRDFSIEQLRTQNILRELFHAFNAALGSKVDVVIKLFEQWRIFFSEAIDCSQVFGGRKLEPLKKWVRKAGLTINTREEAERFFFVLHTYFALLVKLLAWLALSRHIGVKLGGPPFAQLVTADSKALQRSLEELESGGIFRRYGILNLLEGDFFVWYLRAWNENVENAIREIIRRLDEYDPSTLSLVPEDTRDLFKKLYHYLLPREIRHNLGEYYTPDWLAQWLLQQVDQDFFKEGLHCREAEVRRKLLNTRFLDPACGSGTFLVLIIARMLQLGRTLLVPEHELLEAILNNVVGFDLNPLAVLTARVNYILAIADLLQYARGDITIPIYLTDSVRVPAMGEDLFSYDAYQFPTAVGTFRVPAVFCKRERFDKFCDLLEESLSEGLEADAFIERCKGKLSLRPEEWNDRTVALTR
ncbi:MAG: DNA methyltransferase, partial [Thermofilaceae archaeon]